jgi:DNA-binding transcriptional regulator YhcF (GntR family)
VCAQRTAGRFITEDSQMIYKLREDLAKEHADNYLKKMASLGYNRNEAADFLSKVKEEL